MAKRELGVRFYGFKQPYEKTLAFMHELHERVVNKECCEQLMLLEHEPVITITRQHGDRSLLSSREDIAASDITLCEADRGGDVTFHGPGQLIGYPLISLASSDLSFEGYIRTLEKALFDALSSLGLKNLSLLTGFSGIWLKRCTNNKYIVNKLCALGIGVKNGVTKHGFALNLTIDPDPFLTHIIPCGLRDRGVATLGQACADEQKVMPSYATLIDLISTHIADAFALKLKRIL
jgi:lipoate-protein ligase B